MGSHDFDTVLVLLGGVCGVKRCPLPLFFPHNQGFCRIFLPLWALKAPNLFLFFMARGEKTSSPCVSTLKTLRTSWTIEIGLKGLKKRRSPTFLPPNLPLPAPLWGWLNKDLLEAVNVCSEWSAHLAPPPFAPGPG